MAEVTFLSMCCNAPRVRDDSYDAYYCSKCFEWLESQCGDSKCLFCTVRPSDAKPTQD